MSVDTVTIDNVNDVFEMCPSLAFDILKSNITDVSIFDECYLDNDKYNLLEEIRLFTFLELEIYRRNIRIVHHMYGDRFQSDEEGLTYIQSLLDAEKIYKAQVDRLLQESLLENTVLVADDVLQWDCRNETPIQKDVKLIPLVFGLLQTEIVHQLIKDINIEEPNVEEKNRRVYSLILENWKSLPEKYDKENLKRKTIEIAKPCDQLLNLLK